MYTHMDGINLWMSKPLNRGNNKPDVNYIRMKMAIKHFIISSIVVDIPSSKTFPLELITPQWFSRHHSPSNS
jgi:hypothetical protein